MSATIARFGGSVLDRLDAKIATKPGITQATRLPLDAISEDPTQPRRAFDPAALDQLAASIRMVGVLQPVGVAPAPGGRYLLRWGARRLRASKLAGLTDIPAVLVGAQQGDLASQVMENSQRVSNTDTELADAIAILTERGMMNAEIATVLALPDPQTLKHYRVLDKLEPALALWINKASPRCLYELQGAWQRFTADQCEALAAALSRVDELTLTEARRLIAACAAPAAAASVVPTQAAAEPVERRGAAPVKKATDPDAERVAEVRAWLADTRRPRPPLNV